MAWMLRYLVAASGDNVMLRAKENSLQHKWSRQTRRFRRVCPPVSSFSSFGCVPCSNLSGLSSFACRAPPPSKTARLKKHAANLHAKERAQSGFPTQTAQLLMVAGPLGMQCGKTCMGLCVSFVLKTKSFFNAQKH